jgi:hypothetical protein
MSATVNHLAEFGSQTISRFDFAKGSSRKVAMMTSLLEASSFWKPENGSHVG